MAIGSEYPELQATLSGRVFAVISSPAPPETEEPVDGEAEGDDTEDGADVDIDVDVDVEDVS